LQKRRRLDINPKAPVSESASKPTLAAPVLYVQGHTRTWNDSWQRLYSSWNEVIVAFCLRQGLNQHSAQNVCQETMVTVLRSHHGQTAGYDSRQGSFESWLWGVIRNRVKAERRRHGKEVLVAPVREFRDGERVEPLATIFTQPAADLAMAEAEQERQAVWVAALQRVRQRVRPENFQIYAALLEQSSEPEALARQHGKTVNNIYAIKHRCDDLVITEARSIRNASPLTIIESL
jgi:DNA-directed RNA polymerase specialized sigma24 family protein